MADPIDVPAGRCPAAQLAAREAGLKTTLIDRHFGTKLQLFKAGRPNAPADWLRSADGCVRAGLMKASAVDGLI